MLEIARGLGKRHFLNYLFYCRVNGEIAPEVPALAPPALPPALCDCSSLPEQELGLLIILLMFQPFLSFFLPPLQCSNLTVMGFFFYYKYVSFKSLWSQYSCGEQYI